MRQSTLLALTSIGALLIVAPSGWADDLNIRRAQAAAEPSVALPSAGVTTLPTPADTTAIQAKLASYGYYAPVDGWYGPVTERAVRSWQRSNGLYEDGIAGPITRGSLGLDGAVRGPQVQVNAPPPPPPVTGNKALALQAGWSEAQWWKLNCVVTRESRWIPTAYNGVGRDDSYGLMQLNMKAHASWVGPLVAWDYNNLFDPLTNLTIGHNLFVRAGGWGPWSAQDGSC